MTNKTNLALELKSNRCENRKTHREKVAILGILGVRLSYTTIIGFDPAHLTSPRQVYKQAYSAFCTYLTDKAQCLKVYRNVKQQFLENEL